MTEKKKRPHLSYSQLSSYTKCGEAYRRRYVDGHVIPPGVAALRGTSVHKGAEKNYLEKVISRQDMKKEEIVGIAVETFESVVKNEDVWLSADEQAVGKKKILGAAKDVTARLAGLFAEAVAPLYQPAFVEMPHTIELPAATHDLKIVLDLVTEDGKVQDLKTRARASSAEALIRDPQGTIYALGYQNKFGKAPKGIIIDELVDAKKDGPRIHSVAFSPDEDDFGAVTARINTVMGGINAGVFAPAPTGAWNCSEKWCGYWSTCPYVNGKKNYSFPFEVAAGV